MTGASATGIWLQNGKRGNEQRSFPHTPWNSGESGAKDDYTEYTDLPCRLAPTIGRLGRHMRCGGTAVRPGLIGA